MVITALQWDLGSERLSDLPKNVSGHDRISIWIQVPSGYKTQDLATLCHLLVSWYVYLVPVLEKVSSRHLKHFSGVLGLIPPLAFLSFVMFHLNWPDCFQIYEILLIWSCLTVCQLANFLLNWLCYSSALPAVPMTRTTILRGSSHMGWRAEAGGDRFEDQKRERRQ